MHALSRTELYEQVNDWFYQSFPDAPRPLGRNAPAYLRERWIELRDKLLNEEVNRVYWARYPEAPIELDATSPEWEGWRRAWLDIRDEIMANAPEPEDVEAHNAVSETGELDLPHIKATIREWFIDFYNDPTQHMDVLMDTVEEWIRVADELAEDVGRQAMASHDAHGRWTSPERVVEHGGLRARIEVTGEWGAGIFVGWPSFTVGPIE